MQYSPLPSPPPPPPLFFFFSFLFFVVVSGEVKGGEASDGLQKNLVLYTVPKGNELGRKLKPI